MSRYPQPSTEGLPLFSQPPAQAHSPTSQAAARQIRPDASRLRGRVLGLLLERGEQGATDEELQLALSMNPSTERPRRIELVEAGAVRDSGRTRPTRSGRKAVVWQAAEAKSPVLRDLGYR